MAYTVAPLDITKSEKIVDPRSKGSKGTSSPYKWWEAQSDNDLTAQVLSTMGYLKRTNVTRVRQASIFTRLFCGKPLYNYLASSATLDSANQLPIGRPTANVVYSCTDTLVSRISQNKPKPVFLTDGGNYKERKIAEMANSFIQGEFFRVGAYEQTTMQTRDACILGDGILKVFPKDAKVNVERTVSTELLVDFNDGYYGKPRQLMQIKLVDRSMLEEMFPKAEALIAGATHGNVDQTSRSTETISDQIIIVEAWHLRSSDTSKDGRHVIVCDRGVVLDDDWDKDRYPFTKLPYNPNIVGYFSQSLAEILMPGQMEIYRNLIIASQSIELMGVPRFMIDEMSKILETSFNNRVGGIIKYRGNPPSVLNAISNPPEIYQWIQWLIQNSYQMSGISAMSASSQKPAGLNSGEAIRSFDDLQTDRFAAFASRHQNIHTDLAYLMLDCARDIEEETGKYMTVYPGKDGTRTIDFKDIKKLDDNFVIQCFEESSLPKDPAGRQAKLSEMLAAGEITTQEFRRLSNFPDLKQSDRLAASLEERILYSLDEIIENGEKNYANIAPDAFILDPTDLATTLCVNYINLYSTQNLEEEKIQVLRNWYTGVQTLKQQAMPPPVQAAPTPQTGSQLPPPQPPTPQVSPTSNVAV